MNRSVYINSNSIKLLFVIMLLSVHIIPVIGLSFALALLIILNGTKYPADIFKQNIYLLGILCIGLLSTIPYMVERNIYLIFRDIFYFVQPFVYLFLGFSLVKNENSQIQFLKLIVIGISIITLYKIMPLFLNPSMLFDLGLKARYEVGLYNSMSIVTIIIYFYTRKLNIRLFKNTYIWNFIFLLSIFSFSISFSRTLYLALLLILFLPFMKAFRLYKTVFSIISLLIIFIIFGNNLFDYSFTQYQGSDFLTKLMNSLYEITVREHFDAGSINENWRGYEAYLGIQHLLSGNEFQLSFGMGFGTYVETPFWLFQGEKLSQLPIFHNGYITILLKSGFLGLFLFFMYLYHLLRLSLKVSYNNDETKLSSYLLMSMCFLIMLYTLVVHGLYKATPQVEFLVIIGMSLGIQSKYKKRSYE